MKILGSLKKIWNRIKLNYKQKYCNHDWKWLNDERYIGITMSWGLKPTKEFESTLECKKCEKQKKKKYVYWREYKDTCFVCGSTKDLVIDNDNFICKSCKG
jgi:hypothetical protein